MDLAAFHFEHTTILLAEASTKKRAGVWAVRGNEHLASHDPSGLEPLECTVDEFRAILLRENRTVKRALTNPRSISGIGNAYSDEILHAAGLAPYCRRVGRRLIPLVS